MSLVPNKTFRGQNFRWDKKKRAAVQKSLEIPIRPESIKKLIEVLLNEELSEETKISLLNKLSKCFKKNMENDPAAGMPKRLILSIFRRFVTLNNVTSREAAYRALRHLVKTSDDLRLFNILLYPYLLARTIDTSSVKESSLERDIEFDLEHEKVQVFKLLRKVVFIANGDNSLIHLAMVRSLLSLSLTTNHNEKTLSPCILILSELAILNSDLFIDCNGLSILNMYLLSAPNMQIAQSVCFTVLYLLNHEKYRNKNVLNLVPLISSYCDYGDDDNMFRTKQLECSHKIIFTILNSWPGFVLFCDPNNCTGIRSIIDTLLLSKNYIRVHVMDLFYELLDIEVPEWTDEFAVALSVIDDRKIKQTWSLDKNFVFGESRTLLQHLAKNALNVIEIHKALLLCAFLKANLIDNLVEIITNSDKFLSVRATILLGFLLHYARLLLPRHYQPNYNPLSKLLNAALRGHIESLESITTLDYLQKIFNEKKSPRSIFMGLLLRKSRHHEHKSDEVFVTTASVNRMLTECEVLNVCDCFSWKWDIIEVILKYMKMRNTWLVNADYKRFLKKMLDFFKPSSNKYSQLENNDSNRIQTIAAFDFIECLGLFAQHAKPKYLIGFVNDIIDEIEKLTCDNIENCLFSPKNMINTLSCHYFLFIEHLSQFPASFSIIHDSDVWNKICKLTLSKNNECYSKLLIASQNYEQKSSVKILEELANASSENIRMYATKFVRILMRIEIKHFDLWAIEFLIARLSDPSKKIVLEAFDILSESCYDSRNLHILLEHWTDFVAKNPDYLAQSKHLLFANILALSTSIESLGRDFVIDEIRYWCDHFCKQYTLIMEMKIHESFISSSETNTRSPREKQMELFVNNHLFGTLSQHEAGFRLLTETASYYLTKALALLADNERCLFYDELLELKTACWTLAHLSKSTLGAQYLIEHRVIEQIIRIAENHSIFSIRGAAFYALCIIATTPLGADHLEKNDWVSIRYGRLAFFPMWMPQSTVKVEYKIKRTVTEASIRNKWNLNVSLDIEHANRCFDEFQNVSPLCCLEHDRKTDDVRLPKQYSGFCLPIRFHSFFQFQKQFGYQVLRDDGTPPANSSLICGHPLSTNFKCCSHLLDSSENESDREKKLNIVKCIVVLSNPIFGKTSKQILTELQHQYSESFELFSRNFCLFAAVCWNLTEINYSHSSRQFIQNLFAVNQLLPVFSEIQKEIHDFYQGSQS